MKQGAEESHVDDFRHSNTVLRSLQTVKRPRIVPAGSQQQPFPPDGHDFDNKVAEDGWNHDAIHDHHVHQSSRAGCGKTEGRRDRTPREGGGSPGPENPVPGGGGGCSHSPGPHAHCATCQAEGAGETLHLSGRYECEAGEVGDQYLSLARSSPPPREHPRVAGTLEPLEKPVSVLLVKDTPYEGRKRQQGASVRMPPNTEHLL